MSLFQFLLSNFICCFHIQQYFSLSLLLFGRGYYLISQLLSLSFKLLQSLSHLSTLIANVAISNIVLISLRSKGKRSLLNVVQEINIIILIRRTAH